VVHWLEETAFFTVRLDSKKYVFGGVCDLRMRAMVLPRPEISPDWKEV
jgi:hypothetical protein